MGSPVRPPAGNCFENQGAKIGSGSGEGEGDRSNRVHERQHHGAQHLMKQWTLGTPVLIEQRANVYFQQEEMMSYASGGPCKPAGPVELLPIRTSPFAISATRLGDFGLPRHLCWQKWRCDRAADNGFCSRC
jgi:hypothetical protein